MLEGKVAIVTGSSKGIGRAIAVALGRAGAAVTVSYRKDEEGGAQTRQQIEQDGGSATLVQADVSVVEHIQKLIDQTVERFGRLDVMVNNAGLETHTSLLDSNEDDFDKVMLVNLKGPFFGTKLAAQRMIEQGQGGRIINISSIHEDWPMPGNTPYCCAKGGVRMLTRSSGVELAEHSITVVGIAPGAIATPMNRQTLEDPDTRRALQEAIPLRRVGEPEEVAELVAYLASDQARYITATTLVIDGGMMQQSPGL
ncbi:MAG: SDR family oxidoreductase [bacterium]